MRDEGAMPASVVAGNGNEAQIDAWNGEMGEHWVRYRDRREAQLRDFSPHLFAAADIPPGARVVDVGCGCGSTTLDAARQAADGQALGVDLSGPMLAEARRRAADQEVANVSFQQADAQVHPFAPGAFDVLISRFGVMFFSDPRVAFGNLARALRPAGRVVFLCWQQAGANEFYTLPSRALSQHLNLQRRDVPGEPGPFALADPTRLRDILTAAGFEQIDIDTVAEPMWLGSDVEDAVTYQLTTPTNGMALASADRRARDLATAALREALTPHLTPRGVELAGRAWLVQATRP